MKIYEGDKVFYSNREKKQVEECEVIRVFIQFPTRALIKSIESGRIYEAYPDWDCFSKRDDAEEDLRILTPRIIY